MRLGLGVFGWPCRGRLAELALTKYIPNKSFISAENFFNNEETAQRNKKETSQLSSVNAKNEYKSLLVLQRRRRSEGSISDAYVSKLEEERPFLRTSNTNTNAREGGRKSKLKTEESDFTVHVVVVALNWCIVVNSSL